MNDWAGRMSKSVRLLAEQLAGIRPGALSPGFIETFRVASQGRSLSIRQVATVAHRGDRITISPFDRSIVPAIVRSLVEARLNAYALDPATICVTIPPISGEQRAEFARHVKNSGKRPRWRCGRSVRRLASRSRRGGEARNALSRRRPTPPWPTSTASFKGKSLP